MRIFLISLVVLLVAGCSAPACMLDQPYKSAQQFPMLDAPPGLTVPEPNLAMRIPDVKDGPVGVYPDSEHIKAPRMRCLAAPRPFHPDSD